MRVIPHHRARARWEPPPDCRAAVIGDIRLWARDVLGAWNFGHRTDDAVLVLSELATNALLHGRGLRGVELLWLGDSGVLLAVEDRNPELCPVAAPAQGDSGRGLAIVAQLARLWYVETTHRGGKTVCAVLGRGRSAADGDAHAPYPDESAAVGDRSPWN